MTSLADPGVAPAPVGLVADALGTAERGDLLDAPPSTAPGRVRRLAPALIAACVGVVALGGWFAYSEGLLFEDEQPAPVRTAKTTPPDVGDRVEDSVVVMRKPDVNPNAARDELAVRLSADPLEGILEKDDRPSFANDTIVGGPLAPDFLLTDENPIDDFDLVINDRIGDRSGDPLDNSDGAQSVEEMWANATPIQAPEAHVPAEAVGWAQTGRLVVVIEPTDSTDAEAFARRVSRQLYVAFDPSVSRGWGVTSLPSMSRTGLANATGPGAELTGGDVDGDRPTVVSLRLPTDASDEELLDALREMASGVRALTEQRVTLERRSSPGAESGTALTVDNLLWWRKPAPLWRAMDAYHVPVETRVSSGG